MELKGSFSGSVNIIGSGTGVDEGKLTGCRGPGLVVEVEANIAAVKGSSGRARFSGEGKNGGENIESGGGLADYRGGFYRARPVEDSRDADASFPGGAFTISEGKGRANEDTGFIVLRM